MFLYLEDIIKKINDVFGVGLTEEDRIIINQHEEMFKSNNNIMDIAIKILLIFLLRVILREVLLRLRIQMID